MYGPANLLGKTERASESGPVDRNGILRFTSPHIGFSIASHKRYLRSGDRLVRLQEIDRFADGQVWIGCLRAPTHRMAVLTKSPSASSIPCRC